MALYAALTLTKDVLVVLKAYFDGSGNSKNLSLEYLVFAGIAARDEPWGMYEDKWNAMLRDRTPAAEYLHMREAVPLIDGFSPDLGWDRDKADRLISDAAAFICSVNEHEVACWVCVVDSKTHREIRKIKIIDPIEKICADICLGGVYTWYESNNPTLDMIAELYYDQNEDFAKHVIKQWSNRRKKDPSLWATIRTVAQVEMKQTPGVQMADFVGWAFLRHLSGIHRLHADLVARLNKVVRYKFLDRTSLYREHFGIHPPRIIGRETPAN